MLKNTIKYQLSPFSSKRLLLKQIVFIAKQKKNTFNFSKIKQN